MAASARVSTEPAAPVAVSRSGLRRVPVIGAPVAYFAALAGFVVSWGLPLAHDQLFLWVLLGLAAFSVGAWRSWGVMLLAWLPLLSLLVVYDYLRAAVSVSPAQAHVAMQLDIDRWLGGGAV